MIFTLVALLKGNLAILLLRGIGLKSFLESLPYNDNSPLADLQVFSFSSG
jgi:hypothetical protein